MAFKSHLESENKNVSFSLNVLYKIKYTIFTIMTKTNEKNNVF